MGLGSDLNSIKSKAVDYLSRREHSEQELRSKLETKGFDAVLVEEAIQSMIEAGYLSNERYVRMVIRNSYEKGHGPQKIRFKLKQKGIDSSLMNAGLEEFEGDWFSLAQSLRLRKFGELLKTQDRTSYYKEKSRQMRFLAGRGFSMEHIEYAFEIAEEQDFA